MKLYLSSYYYGNYPNILTRLVGTNKKAAVIANSIDFLDDSGRDERVNYEINALTELGFQAEELDLRDYFDSHKDIEQKLSEYGLLWLRGGNVFVLRRAMAQSGFDKVIFSLLKKNKIVYGGYSAGACVITPDLHGLELADDPNIVPEGYKSKIIWEGLGLVGFSIAPRYKSDHTEAEKVAKITDYFVEHNILYKTLHSGEVIVINGDKEEIFG